MVWQTGGLAPSRRLERKFRNRDESALVYAAVSNQMCSQIHYITAVTTEAERIFYNPLLWSMMKRETKADHGDNTIMLLPYWVKMHSVQYQVQDLSYSHLPRTIQELRSS